MVLMRLGPRSSLLFGLLIIACVAPVAAPTPSSTAIQTVAPAPTPSPIPAPTPTPTPVPTPSPTPTPRPSPAAADDPATIATQLTAAERAIRDPNVIGEELAYHGQLQQRVYRRLAAHPEWHDAVVAALPQELRAAVMRNLDASKDLGDLNEPAKELPRWTIKAPAPLEELLRYYREAEAEFGVPWSYLASIHLIETRMSRIHGNSTAGAQGPMQFIPSTWAAFGAGGDINNDRDAIRGAARYLRSNGAPERMANALFRYNNSNSYVRAVTDYAEVMRAEPAAFRGYYQWQVFYALATGDVLLEVGYERK